jgi:hypothetical protein
MKGMKPIAMAHPTRRSGRASAASPEEEEGGGMPKMSGTRKSSGGLGGGLGGGMPTMAGLSIPLEEESDDNATEGQDKRDEQKMAEIIMKVVATTVQLYNCTTVDYTTIHTTALLCCRCNFDQCINITYMHCTCCIVVYVRRCKWQSNARQRIKR